jgi:hypothetical protein
LEKTGNVTRIDERGKPGKDRDLIDCNFCGTRLEYPFLRVRGYGDQGTMFFHERCYEKTKRRSASKVSDGVKPV